MIEIPMNEETFHGFTLKRLRQIEMWFRNQNLTNDILAEEWKRGFMAGVETEREQWQEQLSRIASEIGKK